MKRAAIEKQEDKKPVILVVDDNQQNLELLQAYLEDLDCETIGATAGQQALDIGYKKNNFPYHCKQKSWIHVDTLRSRHLRCLRRFCSR